MAVNSRMKTHQWFKDQELSTVTCTLPDGQSKPVDIMTEKDAQHYFEMQDRGYTFERKLVVHKGVDPDKICTGACEG